MGRGIRWKRRRTLSSLPLRETSKLQLQTQQALLRTACRPAEQFSHTHKAVEKDAYEVWQREQTMPSGPGPPAGHVKGEGTPRLKGPPWRVRDVSHILGASALGFSAKM